MKKKIKIYILSVSIIAILITSVLISGTFYEVFKKEVLKDLKTYTEVIKNDSENESLENYKEAYKKSGIRVTLVENDGDVIFDSEANVSDMNNHGTRPEIEKALSSGEGSSIRKSETLDKSTFYYAILLENGNVLRVSKVSESIWSVIRSATPIVFVITCIIIAVTIVVANLLTKSFLRPIEYMANNIESLSEIQEYNEMVPFIETIQNQHKDIIKNAKMRQEFTANVSHELKTPLTAISGYSELIGNGMANNDDIKRFANEIHRNANRLLVLINDTIRLSQLDVMEKREINCVYMDLYELAEECVNSIKVNAERNDVTISITGTKGIIYANENMMEELIYNLCDNAIKYNKKGGYVQVSVDENEDDVILTVKDNGIGISKEHQKRIFERFYRVDKSRSKSTGGTGLGLAIVKHIVVQHNGKIQLTSEEGKGTEIKVIINNERN